MMAMWAVFSSPLLMSNDLRTVEPWAKKILLNSDVIAVNQDRLGFQAVKIIDNTTMYGVGAGFPLHVQHCYPCAAV